MIVAVDCDGVLADFARSALALQCPVDTAAPTLAAKFGGEEKMWAAIRAHHTQFHEAIKPIRGALRALRRLRLGRHVICATSPPPAEFSPHNWCHERAQWLIRVMEFEQDDIVFARDKSLVRADVLIDDYAPNFIGFRGRTILIAKNKERTLDCEKNLGAAADLLGYR